MRITQLTIYPVKSLRGIALDSARLTERGLAFDRHWMIVDAEGRFVTQREIPAMARVTVRLTEDALVLEHPEAAPLTVALAGPARPRCEVSIWKDRCEALDEGAPAAGWLTEVLGRHRDGALRLVRFPEDRRRAVEADYLGDEAAHTAFPDGYPLLVTHRASLDRLNQRLLAKGLDAVPMSRFRPNLVVEGGAPFAEVDWEALTTESGVRLGLRKPCKRCKIITQDQHTGEAPAPKEPLRTLVEMDTQPGWRGAFFGQNAIPLEGIGRSLRVGERLTAMPRG
ncbi:MOSC domain-containing protein [Halomonas koreensis]|uniref:MOSC N-terminal beta barrel domain-containing protein n=1 Tax=Halomonas koreensis TaxID=245385 RepID=A0ABU1G3J5_9GAMM|nr:MOSC N-terminal beta barrel domain-containing protein [Halomonas koreensis]MDR5867521.1 MOSC N-terminal beta barrel domain-containing protein [Halomonas koreensis]